MKYYNDIKKIEKFLNKNGFREKDRNLFTNDKCDVYIGEDGLAVLKDMAPKDLVYIVTGKNPTIKFNEVFNLYWLIGVLTFHGYIEKNYNI